MNKIIFICLIASLIIYQIDAQYWYNYWYPYGYWKRDTSLNDQEKQLINSKMVEKEPKRSERQILSLNARTNI
uniref:Candidate secreted effector n=1 Tax=Meloidogyne incognita TaxID=6306 RepID=A0A914N736_MELIC